MEKHALHPASNARSQRGRTKQSRTAALPDGPDFFKKALALMTDSLRLAADSDMTADAAVNNMLEDVGDLLGVSRAYVMLDEKDGRYLRNTHEWVNHGTGPAMHSWPLHDYERDLPSLKPLLQEKEFLAAHARDLPPDLEQTLRKQGVDSVLLVPLLREGRRIGLTGCDSCGKKRRWSGEEILLLRHLAHAAVFALDRGECRALRDRLNRVQEALAEDQSGQSGASRHALCEAEPMTLREAERRLISQCLRRCRGNKQRAAAQLGLTWAALDRRCKKLNIEIFKG